MNSRERSREPERRDEVSRAWYASLDRLSTALDERRPENEIRSIIRVCCADARRRALSAERILILLKRRLATVRAVQHVPGDESDGATHTKEHIVSLFIEEYFDAPGRREP
jgi:hypothetical protein